MTKLESNTCLENILKAYVAYVFVKLNLSNSH
jgi:hypothetical protein